MLYYDDIHDCVFNGVKSIDIVHLGSCILMKSTNFVHKLLNGENEVELMHMNDDIHVKP